jgi:UTP--glucose-1-phosphate uridylyltransferase
MDQFEKQFAPFAAKMRAANIPEIAIENFKAHYAQLFAGDTGYLPEDHITPIEALPDAEQLEDGLAEVGHSVTQSVIMLKLNGGLGTSMGLQKAKSLLTVKADLSFLDSIIQQAIQLDIPLVLMNSFATRTDSMAVISAYPELKQDLPFDFLQHKILKVNQSDLSPAEFQENSELEWCPPGHGDIYTALITSGALQELLKNDYRYAFVSNADNLGAVLDPKILGYFVDTGVDFMMEVADRTEADRKGGHLARAADAGRRLILRESAQCPSQDLEHFQDITRHRYFNTNNLWIDLRALWKLMKEGQEAPVLPLIRNAKTVDPADKTSTPVYQLESAMGSAISVFKEAQAIRVPRSRFAPVKTCADLLVVRSDATVLTDDFRIVPHPSRKDVLPAVNLDHRYYRLIQDLEARFPEGPPSLLQCESLSIEGDVRFGRDVVLKGKVRLINGTQFQQHIPERKAVEGTLSW